MRTGSTQQTTHSHCLSLDLLANPPLPRARLISKHLELRRRQLDLIRHEPRLQTPRLRRGAFNNAHRTAALRAHGSLHGLTATRMGILAVDMRGAGDGDFVGTVGNDEGVGGEAAGPALAELQWHIRVE